MSTQQAGSVEAAVETVATFWAHYDDDLIFANPTVLLALDRGQRTRSFFFTAGDAGKGLSAYVDGREAGIRAAYDAMRGTTGAWSDRSVVLGNGVRVTVTQPEEDDRVSLTFLRLPDGGLGGAGYAATGRQSLQQLVTGELTAIRSLDTGQVLTLDLLRSTVAELIVAYGATTVLTHNPGFAAGSEGDHPDHKSVGNVMASVVDSGLIDQNVIRYALGYAAAQRPANLDADILARKLDVFAAYASHDPVVARTQVDEYLNVRGFGEWLQRQYLVSHGELARTGD